jgi:ABC-2 type transport system ATP-binding protein
MIQVNQISKSFGALKAVKNITFSIEKGEIFGLLGPNGAGKSTTINMLSSLLKSDSGSIHLNGIDININSDLCKKNIGIVPQEISLYDEFSAYDNLFFFGKLYNIKPNILIKRIDTILELIGLDDRKNDKIKTYSGGMKRRINIAVALLHEPKIVLMDEPTVGVDPQSRNRIFDIIETLNKQGATIIYTTHYMEEVERLCHRIAIMDKGEIIAQGTLNDLQKQSETEEKIVLSFEELSDNNLIKFKSLTKLPITQLEKIIEITCHINNDLHTIIENCHKSGLIINDIKLKKVNLEAVFLKLTGKNLRD